MAKHIGIVGSSYEGTALCYREICSAATKVFGDHTHPEITLHNFNFADYMNRIWQDDWDGAGDLLLASVHKLADAGAELIICPDNTLHRALPAIRDRIPVPFIDIAEVVTREALEADFSTVGLLGTNYLMDSSVYPEALGNAGLRCEIPEEADRNRIDRIIFVELVDGLVTDDARTIIHAVIERLADRGCDAVALACTELSLLIRPGETAIPTLDSTRLLARAALAAARA